MSSSAAALYRIFKRADGAAPVRTVVIALIALACAGVAVGAIRVTRQHEVLRLGYQLAHATEHVRALREVRSRLEVERATLTSPDRIRRLATELGMTPVAPDKIRIVHAAPMSAMRSPRDVFAEAARVRAP